MTNKPFSSAFDSYWSREEAYWNLPSPDVLLGFWARKWLKDKSPFFTADTSVLPQLSELDQCYPKAEDVDMCCSSCICFRLPGWPDRLLVHVKLASPPISFLAKDEDYYTVSLVRLKKKSQKDCCSSSYDLNTTHTINKMDKITELVDAAFPHQQ